MTKNSFFDIININRIIEVILSSTFFVRLIMCNYSINSSKKLINGKFKMKNHNRTAVCLGSLEAINYSISML
ncbi:hypothetical protein HLVA_19400 [Haliovirga abyssi]|uniref:Uncharacterized protein n=1 Tax=Haliovirga abyssi TaxID=2996794 RepID=A0AAU9D5M5_9FUSO|nr:hypothetical protein HLVA_19400 [Haliovirga abyssi]